MRRDDILSSDQQGSSQIYLALREKEGCTIFTIPCDLTPFGSCQDELPNAHQGLHFGLSTKLVFINKLINHSDFETTSYKYQNFS